MNYLYTALYFLAAFVIGSIPVGEIVSRLLGRGSLFRPGEWGPMYVGDVFSILGRPLGILVTFIDLAKGYLAVTLLIQAMLGPASGAIWWEVSVGGLLVVVGHCHSLFLGFRGGRGASTSAGVLLALLPVPTIAALLLWASLAFWGLSTRPGTVSAACAMPLFSVFWVWMKPEQAFYLYVVVFLSLWGVFEYRRSLLTYLGMGPKGNTPPPPDVAPSVVNPTICPADPATPPKN